MASLGIEAGAMFDAGIDGPQAEHLYRLAKHLAGVVSNVTIKLAHGLSVAGHRAGSGTRTRTRSVGGTVFLALPGRFLGPGRRHVRSCRERELESGETTWRR